MSDISVFADYDEETRKTFSTEEVYDLAEAGAEFMDLASPGWFEKIDLSSLEMRSCDHCVLGQLYGNYYRGVSKMDSECHPQLWAVKNAFALPHVPGWDPSWRTLRIAWESQIEKRLADAGKLA